MCGEQFEWLFTIIVIFKLNLELQNFGFNYQRISFIRNYILPLCMLNNAIIDELSNQERKEFIILPVLASFYCKECFS